MQLLKIGYIAKMFGLTVQSIRHYEKIGLIRPAHIADNGYRYYSVQQFWMFNMIVSLKSLGVSLAEIKSFLEQRTLRSNEDFIEYQIGLIDEKIASLYAVQQELKQRQGKIRSYQQQLVPQPVITYFEQRKALSIKAAKANVWEVDGYHGQILALNKISPINYMGWGKAGAVPTKSCLHGADIAYERAFILSDEGDYVIDEGRYLTYRFKGDYLANYKSAYDKMKKFAAENQLDLVGDILELYLYDVHDTSITDERITEIQIRLE